MALHKKISSKTIFFFEIHTVSELVALDVIATDNPEAEFVEVLLYKSEDVCVGAKLGDSEELLFPVGDTEAG